MTTKEYEMISFNELVNWMILEKQTMEAIIALIKENCCCYVSFTAVNDYVYNLVAGRIEPGRKHWRLCSSWNIWGDWT